MGAVGTWVSTIAALPHILLIWWPPTGHSASSQGEGETAFIAAALPVLTAIGAGVSAISTVAGGIASRNQANYQAEIAKNNQTIALQNAVRAEQAGMVQTEAQGRKGAARMAGIKTGQAAAGLNVNTGTPVDVQVGQREINQLDTETVLNNAELHAYGYRTQAMNFDAEERAQRAKADNAVPASLLKAGGGLLANASALGGKWTTGSGAYEADSTDAEDLAAGIRPI